MPSLPEPIWRRRIDREFALMQQSGYAFSSNADKTEYELALEGPGLSLEGNAVLPRTTHSVRIRLTREFPYAGGIEVTWLSPIFHPNIRSEDGKVCIQLLNAWSADVTVANLVAGIISLLEHPNPSDPLNKPAADYFLAHPDALNSPRPPETNLPKRPRILSESAGP